MYLTVNGHPTYCYTGGKTFDAAKPTVVFIHGVLNDHSVWILQTRYLAHHGWNVLARRPAGPLPQRRRRRHRASKKRRTSSPACSMPRASPRPRWSATAGAR